MMVDQMLAAGLAVVQEGAGRIRVTGPEPVIQRWAGKVAASKSELLAQLVRGEPSDLLERFEERAAIIEFDGQMTRERAEGLAWHEVFGAAGSNDQPT